MVNKCVPSTFFAQIDYSLIAEHSGMLLKIDSGKILMLAVAVGLVFLVGQAQARIDVCKSLGEKNLSCVLQLN